MDTWRLFARASALFDDVIVGVAHNSSKKYLFSLQERVNLVERSLAERGITTMKVEVIPPGVLFSTVGSGTRGAGTC